MGIVYVWRPLQDCYGSCLRVHSSSYCAHLNMLFVTSSQDRTWKVSCTCLVQDELDYHEFHDFATCRNYFECFRFTSGIKLWTSEWYDLRQHSKQDKYTKDPTHTFCLLSIWPYSLMILSWLVVYITIVVTLYIVRSR